MSGFLAQYATEKGNHIKINYVNPDRVHALVNLPTSSASRCDAAFEGGFFPLD